MLPLSCFSSNLLLLALGSTVLVLYCAYWESKFYSDDRPVFIPSVATQGACLAAIGKYSLPGNGSWSPDDMRAELQAFLPVYNKHITEEQHKNNNQNQSDRLGLDHAFALWYILRKLQPDVFIEVPAYAGQAVWVAEDAVPGAKKVTLGPDIFHPMQWSNASTPNSTYGLLWDGHADFKKGLAEVAASNGGSLSRALMFVGDHQSAIQRLTQASDYGLHQFVFHKNGIAIPGDRKPGPHTYSLKELCNTDETLLGFHLHRFDLHRTFQRPMSLKQHRMWADVFSAMVEHYMEFPPIADPDAGADCFPAIAPPRNLLSISPKALYSGPDQRKAFEREVCRAVECDKAAAFGGYQWLAYVSLKA